VASMPSVSLFKRMSGVFPIVSNTLLYIFTLFHASYNTVIITGVA
jgi:hypothetical protein